ncbi:MAG: DUF11 domain-containing protein [Filimonas sp.]|nr:DUF11 domain-containing protein [Filimonas sp.]
MQNMHTNLFVRKTLLFFIVAIFINLTGITGFAQTCTGSLGDPIFKETFGDAGTTVKPTLGPALPPGITTYTYYSPATVSRPVGPYPGQYTISNTTRGYNNTYFVDRPDHTTGTGTGYCMVVDANATPDKFYERTITGLCAGTTFEFSAWIMNINPNTSSGTSKPSLRFDIVDASNNTVLKSVSTGTIDYDPNASTAWKRQSGIFQMPQGTSTIILRIYSNTPSSNGNDLALDDIAFAACGPPISFTQNPGVVCSNSTAGFTVSLPSGSYSHYYFKVQKRPLGTTAWADEGNAIDNGTSNTYNVSISNAKGGFEYRVIAAGGLEEFNNVYCRVASDPVELKVIDFSVNINGPSFVCYNNTATLNAVIVPSAGTGTPASGYTYTWEQSDNGSGPWTTVAGVTGATYTTPALTAAKYYRVSATVSGCGGNGVSSVFQLQVNPQNTATLSPVAQLCVGGNEFLLLFKINSGSPDNYTISSSDLPNFNNILNNALTASPLRVGIPSGTQPGTYHLNFSVRSSADGCSSVSYPFTITINPYPDTAKAGTDQQLCAATTAQLNATAPAIGTGTWSQLSGPSTSVIANPNLPGTGISNLQTGTYVYQWSVANSVCPVSVATVSITNVAAAPAANAGNDTVQYNSGQFRMNANAVASPMGTWTVASGSATIQDIHDPNTIVTLAPNTTAILVWTINNGTCPPGSDSVKLTYTRAADIRISKVVQTAGPYIAGQSISYRIVITNAGPSDATSVRITDALPAGFTPGSIATTTINGAAVIQNNTSGSNIDITGAIPANVNAQIMIDVSGKISAAFSGNLSNTATAVSQNEPDPDGATATVVIPVVRKPYFLINKTGPSQSAAGVPITYVIIAQNTGISDAVNAVITDTIATTITGVTWSATATGKATIVSGATGSGTNISVTANMPGSDTGAIRITVTGTIASGVTGNILNKAILTPSETPAGIFVSNTVTTNVFGSPGLAISKSRTSGPAIAGNTIAYDIILQNNGPSDAVASVIRDTVPAMISQVQWTAIAQSGAVVVSGATGTGNIIAVTANVPAGALNVITIHVTGTISPDFAGDILNRAVAIPAEAGGQTVTAQDLTTVTKQVRLTIQKNAPPAAYAGQQGSFTIDVTNTGVSNATGAVISDVVPIVLSNITWTASVLQGTGQITSGATGAGNNVLVTANINAGATVRIIVYGSLLPNIAGAISNTATVTPSEPNTSPASSTTITNISIQSILAITKAGPDSLNAGTPIRYVLEAHNAGPSNALGTIITDVIPPEVQQVTWTAQAAGNARIISGASGTGNQLNVKGDIPADANSKIILIVNGIVSSATSGSITNKAVITPADTGSKADSAIKVTKVSRLPSLIVTKSAVDRALAGDSLTYYIEVTNTGNADAINSVIADNVPAQISGVIWKASITGNGSITGPSSGTGNAISITASLRGGASNKLVLTVTGKISPAYNGTLTNTVTVTPAEPIAPLSATKVVTVGKIPQMRVSKVGPAELEAGETIFYEIIINNPGKSDANALTLRDSIPGAVESITWKAETTGSAVIATGQTGAGNILTLTGDLPAGAGNSIVIKVTGKVKRDFSGTFENIATVIPSETGADTVISNPVFTTVTRIPRLDIVKAAPATANAGETITYILTALNSGTSNAKSAAIIDSLPLLLLNPQWTAAAPDSAVILQGASGSGSVVNVVADMPAGSKILVTVTGKIPNNTSADSIVNIARIVPSEPGAATGYSFRKVTKIGRMPSLTIGKTGPASLYAGETIAYVLSISNAGPSIAGQAVITDTLPVQIENSTWTATANGNSAVTSGQSGTGNIIRVVADIVPGNDNVVTITISGTVNDYYQGSLTNIATVTPTEAGIAPVRSPQLVTDVTRYAEIDIIKTAPATVTPGNRISYGFSIYNRGPSSARDVVIRDIIPSTILNATWAAVTAGSAVITSDTSGTGNTLMIKGNLPPVSKNAKILIEARGIVDPAFTGTDITNTAVVYNDPAITTAPQTDTSTAVSVIQRYTNLRISKSGPANGSAGQQVQYMLRVQNNGPSDVFSAVVQDLLPPGVINATWTATSFSNVTNITPASGTGNVQLTANMAAENSDLRIVITGTFDPSLTDGSVVTNTATVALPPGSTAIDPIPADNSSTVNTTIDNTPSLRVAKSGPAVVTIGDPIQYTVVVTNGGVGDITGITITDAVPVGIQVTSWSASTTGTATITGPLSGSGSVVNTGGNIPAGAANSIVLVIDGTVTSAAGSTLVNTVTAQAGTTKQSSVTTTVNRSTDVGIVKSGPKNVVAGQEAGYTIEVFNYGPLDADSIVIRDQIPAELINLRWYALATGNATVLDSVRIDSTGNSIILPAKIAAGSANYITLYVVGKVDGSVAAATISNTASVDVYNQTDFNTGNNSSTIQTTVSRSVNLQLRKTGAATLYSGSPISYQLILTNTGPSDAVNIALEDVVPVQVENTQWSVAVNGGASVSGVFNGTGNHVQTVVNIPAGQGSSVVITINGNVNNDFAGIIHNTATAKGSTTAEGNASADFSTNVLRKSALTIDKTGPLTVTAGGRISYVIRAQNYGPSYARNIVVTDTLDGRLTQITWAATSAGGAVFNSDSTGTGNIVRLTASLPPGGVAAITIAVSGTVPSGATGSLVNTATITSPDSLTAAVVSPPVTTLIVQKPILNITKLAPSALYAGDSIRYVIAVMNTGLSDARNAVITDLVPAMITGVNWHVENTIGTVVVKSASAGTGNNITLQADIASQATLLITVTGRVNTSFAGTITNTAIVTPAEVPDAQPDTAMAQTNVSILPILEIAKSGPTLIVAGQPVSYTITVTNVGPSLAQNAVIIDDLDPRILQATWTATARGISVIKQGAQGSGNKLLVTADIAPGDSDMISITVTGVTAGSLSDSLVNKAVVRTAETNRSDTAVTKAIVQMSSNIRIQKTGPSSVTAGDNIAYQITVYNDGPSDITQLNIRDTIPAAIQVTGWTVTGAGNTNITGPVSGTSGLINILADIKAGAGNNILITVNGKVALTTQGNMINTAYAIPAQPGAPVRLSSVTTNVQPAAPATNVRISKTGPSEMIRGQRATYVISVYNYNAVSLPVSTIIADTITASLENVTWTAEAIKSATLTGSTSGSGNIIAVPATLPSDTSGVRIVVTGSVKQTAPLGQVINIAYARLTNVNNFLITSPPVISIIHAVADIEVNKIGPATVFAGNKITYQLIVTNHGLSDANATVVTDSVPAGLTQVNMQLSAVENGAGSIVINTVNGLPVATIGTFPSGAKATFVVTGIAGNAPATLMNKAVVKTATGIEDRNPSNDQSSVLTTVRQKIQLRIVKSATPLALPYRLGQQVTFSLQVSNSGISDVNPVVVSDTLPVTTLMNNLTYTPPVRGTVTYNALARVLTWQVGQVRPGEAVNWQYNMTVSGGGTARNIAVVSGPPDVSLRDSSTVTLPLGLYANLKVTKALLTVPPLTTGKTLEFVINATNNGPDTATRVVITDTLAPELAVPSTISDGGVYDAASRAITWIIPVLSNGASQQVRFTTRLLSGQQVNNTARVSGNEIDVDLSDNIFTIAPGLVSGDDIFIPNAITPNGDGKNDQFIIGGLTKYPGSELSIYNRWQNQVYHSYDYKNDWNATGLNAGTYYYLLKLRQPDGNIRLYKGWILVGK